MADQPKKEVRSIIVHFDDFTTVILTKQTWPTNNGYLVENLGQQIAKASEECRFNTR